MNRRRIGLDLDGVIADQTIFKRDKFFELFQLRFEPWQLTSNVIDDYATDRERRRTVGRLSGVATHTHYCEKNTLEILTMLVEVAELYLISSRGKSEEGIAAGYRTIESLGLRKVFSPERIFFVKDYDAKATIVSTLCDVYVDDRLDVIEKLSKTRVQPVLYDPYNLILANRLPVGSFKIASLRELDTMPGGLH